jgi:hypothetical protein
MAKLLSVRGTCFSPPVLLTVLVVVTFHLDAGVVPKVPSARQFNLSNFRRATGKKLLYFHPSAVLQFRAVMGISPFVIDRSGADGARHGMGSESMFVKASLSQPAVASWLRAA